MSHVAITDILVIVAGAFLAGLACRRLGISLLVGYLVTGAVLGEGALEWITGTRGIEELAEAGVLLLLFSIGLEFTLEDLVRLRGSIFVGGFLQMTLVAVSVMLAAMAFETSWRGAILLGSAVAMSSTVLVFKALAEVGRTTTPAGRRMISILLFQDVAIVPLLLVVPLLVGDTTRPPLLEALYLTGKTLLIVAGVLLMRRVVGRWVMPVLAKLRSPELIVMFAVTVLGLVVLGVHHLGLPAPLGAFAAGLILSGNRLTGQVDALILSFREVFAAVFFVSLGLLFDPAVLKHEPWLVVGGFIALLVVKAGAATIAARATGLNWRAARGVGMGLAQVGEFAFVLAFAGWDAGLLTEEHYNRLILYGLGSLALTPRLLRIGLRWATQRPMPDEIPRTVLPRPGTTEGTHPVAVIGIGVVGRRVARELRRQLFDVTLVDLSPVNLHGPAQDGFKTVAGDARDPQVLDRASVGEARAVVVCVPDDRAAVSVVSAVRKLNRTCSIVARCRYVGTETQLRKAGAQAIINEETEAVQAFLRFLGELESITDLDEAPD